LYALFLHFSPYRAPSLRVLTRLWPGRKLWGNIIFEEKSGVEVVKKKDYYFKEKE